MEDLTKALAHLDKIDPNDDPDLIKKKALEAYHISPRCLDALILLARLEKSYLKKIELLEDGLKREDRSSYHFPLDDSFLSRQFLRYLKEMLDLYLSYGDLIKAYRLVDYMTSIKKENIYHIKEDKLILSVYFNDEEVFKESLKEDLDPFVRDLALYVHHLENGLDYQNELMKLITVYGLDEYLAKDDEDENGDDRRYVLARYAFILNRSYLTLHLILKV